MIVLTNKEFRIKSANKAFYRKFGLKEEETEGVLLYDLGNRECGIFREIARAPGKYYSISRLILMIMRSHIHFTQG